MNKLIYLILFCPIILCLACSSGSSNECSDVLLTESENGSEQTICHGKILTVKLYDDEFLKKDWVLKDYDDSVLDYYDYNVLPEGYGNSYRNAYYFIFQAELPGETVLNFSYGEDNNDSEGAPRLFFYTTVTVQSE